VTFDESPMLPALRRAEMLPERVLYVARPGLGALPSGALTVAAFAALQGWTLIILLWAVWWPAPRSTHDYAYSITATTVLAGLVVGVLVLLLRRNPGFATAVMRAPFIRITVTDRRVLWTLPWDRRPLMEIGRQRVVRAVIGTVDRRGRGNAAMELVPGDPSADIDGHIHFDRLPQARAFVAALHP
jgi:hypothetical protein